MNASFDYQTAFGRNLGLVSPEQQKRLRRARVAIAGLGGVGGAEALALVRLGIGRFTLADLDTYELSNFNRQLGATMATIGRSKVEVTAEAISAVNPTAEIRLVPEGITDETIDEFLEGADAVIDALDFSCFKERFLLYKRARALGKWVLNIAPPGFGSTLLFFSPAGMTFEEYFGIHEGMSIDELSLSIMYGVMPVPIAIKYFDLKQINASGGRFPCVSAAFFLVAGIATAEVFNLLAGGNPPKSAPHVYQFDAFLRTYKSCYHWLGMRAPGIF